jgi:hypothetical protein
MAAEISTEERVISRAGDTLNVLINVMTKSEKSSAIRIASILKHRDNFWDFVLNISPIAFYLQESGRSCPFP